MPNQFTKIKSSDTLQNKFPKLAKELHKSKNNLNPNNISYGSNKKVWWTCPKGHEYEMTILSRTSQKQNCPYCSNKRIGYGNDFKTNFPEIAKEWNYKLNKSNPEDYFHGYSKKVWWTCPKGHEYEMTINARTNQKQNCPYCSNKRVGYGNDLKTNYPKVAKEWNHKKNNLKASQYSPHSSKKVWWTCPKGHEYEMSINARTAKRHQQGCPYCSGTRVGYGNDLKTNYPKVAKEWNHKKNNLKASQYSPHSGLKVWWLCPKGHEYEMRIAARTDRKKPQGCSYCAGKIVGYGNDLKSKYPKLAKQWDADKNKDKPNEIIAGSKKKRWFLCKKGHSFETEVYAVVNHPDKCPYCSNKKAGYGNDLKTNYPEIAKEWNYKKNDTNPENHLPQTNKKVWWICSKKHEYEMLIYSRTAKRYQQGCPYCSNKKAGYGNDLKTNYPEIAKEWNYEKNSIRPEQVVPLSVKKAWFKCKNNHDHYQSIAVKVKGHDCPYCTGNLIGYGNDLKSNYPDIAKEWDYKKNKMKPEDVGPRSGKKAWWICQNGHSFDQVIADRTREDIEIGCRFCRLTPRSREEIYLAYELKKFFKIDLKDQRVLANKEYDVDIVIRDKNLIIEYDGSYWHQDNQIKDISKTKDLEKHGWVVIRVREKPLKILSRKFNVSSNAKDYKETANKVLKKINSLGYELDELDRYLERKMLINKKNADKFITQLIKEKNK